MLLDCHSNHEIATQEGKGFRRRRVVEEIDDEAALAQRTANQKDHVARQAPDLADPAERALVDATWTLARTGDLTDEQYAAAEAELGQAGLFELTTLVGYYSTLALQLRVFRVETPR